MTPTPANSPLILVTGLPQYTTRRVVAELAAADVHCRFAFLVPERWLAKARRFLARLPGPRERYQVYEGEVRKMDLGLSGTEYRELAAEVSVIHHAAAVFHLGVEHDVAQEINVQGTEEIIEFSRSCQQLRQLVHYSTVSISGDFKGVWGEGDYDRGQRFNNHYEATKFQAEGLVRAAQDVPATILRAPVIVGDSTTGEIDRYDGAHQLMLLFIALPVDLGLPLPGRATRFINLIPVDYFARAVRTLAPHPDALGRTFHLVDPEPLTMAQVFELVAMASEKKAPSGYIPARLTRALVRTPGLERFADSPMAALDLFTTDVVYASWGAQEILRDSRLRCPAFPEYVENLVGFLRQKIARETAAQKEEQVYDPLW